MGLRLANYYGWLDIPSSTFWSDWTEASYGKVYDPEKYDLVPKDSYKKELIDKKEKRIAELDEQKKQLTDEIEKLKSG